jgi:hypothetical protein
MEKHSLIRVSFFRLLYRLADAFVEAYLGCIAHLFQQQDLDLSSLCVPLGTVGPLLHGSHLHNLVFVFQSILRPRAGSKTIVDCFAIGPCACSQLSSSTPDNVEYVFVLLAKVRHG